ncbi:Y-family DNA polymerase [Enterococcus timonensis]|uniref:Y-family DNA polymerase n=1 Tax=Enterococcus timonensis TaxID=1852364 RepID=UPI0008DA3D66|nr:Y-family DNA polymerase [Enterococcus timonensis]
MTGSSIVFDYQKEPHREILCIDCRSFYASVECAQHGWDPLTTPLVVMSYPSDNPAEEGSGLILASSPTAKKLYGISNVSRARDLPFPYPKELKIVPPRMRLYMEMNQKINRIYKKYCDEKNHLVYSVDESFLDVTDCFSLFNVTTAYEMAQMIQQDVFSQTGINTAVGIGDNPLLAKLALDNEAKKNTDHIATWRYENVPEKLWQIKEITDFWGIGKRTARRLQLLGIANIKELAEADYFRLKEHFGVVGEQLYAHAWGIDRSFLGESVTPKSKSLGNSQVLPRDYEKEAEIEIVIKEMADQVATRLRKKQRQAQVISLWIGYSIGEIDRLGRGSFSQQQKVTATNSSKKIAEIVLEIFRKNYQGQKVRQVGIHCGNLVEGSALQLDLFSDPDVEYKKIKTEHVVDVIRRKYGFKSIVHASSLMEGGRAIARSSLVGGHAGGMGGLEEPEEKN